MINWDFENDIWAIVCVDSEGYIQEMNRKADGYFGKIVVGKKIFEVFSWFRKEWLSDKFNARIIKSSAYDKLLMEKICDNERNNRGQLLFFFKNVDEYRNITHLWCEVEDSLIRLQPFIDNSHDGIIITNGQGVVRATNKAFCSVSGLSEDDILGKSIYDLNKKENIPFNSIMKVIETKQVDSSVAKFPKGKETIMSSKPLFDRQGNIIRVLSNVRDLTELEELYEKIRSAEALAKHFQREIEVKNATENLSLGFHRSRKMDELYELVKKVADTNLPLLLLGESGVGKTALAKYIHELSDRKDTGTFVHINCSAIPDSLLESELFGYEAGAFSGANKTKIGLFEIAQKGTILLDEIGDMPLLLQSKLLNVLQEKQFYRIGGTKVIPTDVRVIAATNQNLVQLVFDGRFRQDLFYRLNVIPITIPALRERTEDIAPLIAYTLREANNQYGCSKSLARDTVLLLEAYEWPGNIRELKNIIERLVVLIGDDVIEPHHLPPDVVTKVKKISCDEKIDPMNNSGRNEPIWNPGNSLKGTISDIENRVIEEAVVFYGSVKLAAKKLGVDESTLTRKRSKYRNMEQE